MLDAGDLLGSSLRIGSHKEASFPIMAQAMVDAYNRMGLDAFTPGEGDLALGLDRLVEMLSSSRFPVLAANLLSAKDGSRPFGALLLKDVGGTLVGVIGVLDDEIRGADRAALQEAGVMLLPPEPVVRKALEVLRRAGAQLVVLNAHMDQKRLGKLLHRLGGGVQVAVSGHVRGGMKRGPVEVAGGVVIGGGYRGKDLARLVLKLREGSTTLLDAQGARGFEKKLTSLQRRISHYEGSLSKIEEKQKGKEEPGKDRRTRRRRLYARNLERALKEKAELEQRIAAYVELDSTGSSTYSFTRVRMGSQVPQNEEVAELVRRAKAEMLSGLGSRRRAVGPAPSRPLLRKQLRKGLSRGLPIKEVAPRGLPGLKSSGSKGPACPGPPGPSRGRPPAEAEADWSFDSSSSTLRRR